MATEGLWFIFNLHSRIEVKRTFIIVSVCSCVSPRFLDKNTGFIQSYQSCFLLKHIVSPGFTASFLIRTSDHNKSDGSYFVLISLVGEILYLLGSITLFFLVSCQYFFFFFPCLVRVSWRLPGDIGVLLSNPKKKAHLKLSL